MTNIVIIDTETNWNDVVMSIGAVIADPDTFEHVSSKYYIIDPEHKVGGMYSNSLFFEDEELNFKCSRDHALRDLTRCFENENITEIFAYNASFDYRHLPELSSFNWYDIMKLAAYKQHNPKIPEMADCCRTGRLRSGYGVESILRLLSDDASYREQHNALTDAVDELKIMKLLQHKPNNYIKINKI